MNLNVHHVQVLLHPLGIHLYIMENENCVPWLSEHIQFFLLLLGTELRVHSVV